MGSTKWALSFVMMVLGLLLTTQFRVTQQASTDPGRLRAEELSVALTASEQERKQLAAEVAQLRRAAAAQPTQAPQQDVTALELMAGTTEVHGPGITVVLSEATDAPAARVSDEDLWRVLNELRTAGAEALSVNGQRVTALTGIRNVGQRIMVNQTMVASPIEVVAIGDPVILESSLRLRGGVIEVMDTWGIKAILRRTENATVPAVRSKPSFGFAKPALKP